MESKLRNMRKKLLTVVMSCLMLVGMMPATMQAFAEGTSDVATTHQAVVAKRWKCKQKCIKTSAYMMAQVIQF